MFLVRAQEKRVVLCVQFCADSIKDAPKTRCIEFNQIIGLEVRSVEKGGLLWFIRHCAIVARAFLFAGNMVVSRSP